MRRFGGGSRRSKIPANLSKVLERSLAEYALAASAAGVATLAFATPAEAAPVCKNLSVDLSYTATYAFDPVGQGVAAFNLAQSYRTFSTHTSTGVNRGFFTPNLRGAAAALSSKGLVAALASGASIGPAGHFGKGAAYGLIFTFTPYSGATSQRHRGNVRFGQAIYLGFKFLNSGQPHYGWLRLQSSIVQGFRTPHVATTIMSYGYESAPNTAIQAGSCSATSQPAAGYSAEKGADAVSLGMLAIGAQGLPLWRRR